MVDLGAILLAAISLPVKPFLQSNDDGTCFLAGNHGCQRMNNDSKHHPPFEASSLLFELNQNDRVASSLVVVSTLTCVNERITEMISAGPFVAGLKYNGNVYWGFSAFAWQRVTL